MQPQNENSSKRTVRRYKEGDNKFGHWQEKIFQGDWSYKCPTYVLSSPPCQGACPAGEDIRSYMNIARGIEKPPLGADGKSMPWEEYAWRRITDANPFPAIMGRCCPAPCQTKCNREKVDEFVGINSIEHYVGDWAIEKGLSFAPPETENGKRVAIIGGGVAGLSCAYQLRRKGYACTVFEANHKIGGMITFGLPDYRTQTRVVDAEVKRILDMGVAVRLNTRVGRDVSIDELRQNFDAIFVGIGALKSNPLELPGADAPNCVDGLAFLHNYNDGRMTYAGKNIVVVGGGNTAMDCASVARRLGSYNAAAEATAQPHVVIASSAATVGRSALATAPHHWRRSAEVVIAYRRKVVDMPADQHEIEAVLEEGVDIQPCVVPVEVIKDEYGMAKALRVVRVEWVDKKMVVQAGTEYDIPCDLIVTAVGQSVNWGGLAQYQNERGLARVDKNLMTEPGVFCGGDVIKPLLLTTAIGHGRIASEGIDRYLSGMEMNGRPKVDVKHFSVTGKMIEIGARFEDVKEPILGTDTRPGLVHNFEDRSPRHVIPAESLYLGHFPQVPRNVREMREINESNVLGSLEERLIGLDEAQVKAEAKRCMSCGLCLECDNCILYCPQGAVKKVPKKESTTGRYVITEYDKCVGCHICADVCPTGYIQMGLDI